MATTPLQIAAPFLVTFLLLSLAIFLNHHKHKHHRFILIVIRFVDVVLDHLGRLLDHLGRLTIPDSDATPMTTDGNSTVPETADSPIGMKGTSLVEDIAVSSTDQQTGPVEQTPAVVERRKRRQARRVQRKARGGANSLKKPTAPIPAVAAPTDSSGSSSDEEEEDDSVVAPAQPTTTAETTRYYAGPAFLNSPEPSELPDPTLLRSMPPTQQPNHEPPPPPPTAPASPDLKSSWHLRPPATDPVPLLDLPATTLPSSDHEDSWSEADTAVDCGSSTTSISSSPSLTSSRSPSLTSVSSENSTEGDWQLLPRGLSITASRSSSLTSVSSNDSETGREAAPFTRFPPRPLNPGEARWVGTTKELWKMVQELEGHAVIAVDLEGYHLGAVCLIQISTARCNYLIDALALKWKLHVLNRHLSNPYVIKVMHGAIHDLQWLRHDCNVHVVNLFDTHFAARQLNLHPASLAFLVEHFCGVRMDKSDTLSDWRLRPLTPSMHLYAQADTHYLLHVHACCRSCLSKTQTQKVLHDSARLCFANLTKPPPSTLRRLSPVGPKAQQQRTPYTQGARNKPSSGPRGAPRAPSGRQHGSTKAPQGGGRAPRTQQKRESGHRGMQQGEQVKLWPVG